MNKQFKCSCRPTDRTVACGATNVGSIPTMSAINAFVAQLASAPTFQVGNKIRVRVSSNAPFMSDIKQIPKIISAFQQGSNDKINKIPSKAKQYPKCQQRAYKNGYKSS